MGRRAFLLWRRLRRRLGREVVRVMSMDWRWETGGGCIGCNSNCGRKEGTLCTGMRNRVVDEDSCQAIARYAGAEAKPLSLPTTHIPLLHTNYMTY